MSLPHTPAASIPSLPPHDAARERWDVVVIGGGPAGAAAAWHLARQGRRALVVERSRPPRDKVCGDGLIADSLRALDAMELGTAVRRAAHAVDRVRIYSPGRIAFDVPGEFLTLRRRELDTILLRGAVERGAALTVDAAAAVMQDDAGVTVTTAGGAVLRAPYAVLATGADTSLLGTRPGRPSAVALRTYVRAPGAGIDALTVSFDRSIIPGYAWIFPMGDDEYNVGCGVFYGEGGVKPAVNLRAMLRTFLRELPAARALGIADPQGLEGARLRCGLAGAERVRAGRIVCAGETIGTTFPFTGEGIGKAMETGALAALHLHAALGGDDAALDRLGARIREELAPKYLGYDVAQRWLSHAWLADLLAWRVTRSARLHAKVGGILNETVDPRSVFSLRGLVPALLR
jgi:geranylgeranyl reductase family protein